ncbi:MAG TPA: 3'-5' exonuclease [Thermodesulfobacteriota bacterium]|nr:3'-5' exonuclease [Thermodesulfobacteriota bacterium]
MAIRKYEGTICLVASVQDLKRAIHVIRREQVVGLDTETKPTFHKGQFHLPCLVQIATGSVVYLFQLKRMEFSGTLVEVLENPALIKAGIGLADDFKALKKVFPFEPQNTIDLSLVAQQQGIKQSSVRNLAGQLLGFRITKGSSTSNWASSRLTLKQITYAATDAWVCRELFLRFQQLGFLDLEGRPLSKMIGERKGYIGL